ncbi:hypothetical protein [Thermodesulfatator atlanticus]|uniref:hypothetical protein n=1 Tax=Thermodesulfatator atlanticus TaxID=501497 RepID=UPI0003B5169F|nr:hypothetical protein [Thermodesulfatator atlanticus]
MGGYGKEINWENESHVFFLNANYIPMPKLEMAGTISYTIGKAEMDDMVFYASEDPFDLDGYSFENLTGVENFSDLDYRMLELEMAATYHIRNNLSFTLNYWYADFEDDEPYVYGDLDGDAYSVTGFITYRF